MRAYFKIPEKIAGKKFKGQGELIVKVMGDTAETAKTVETLARDIAVDLITRQDPKRVVMFYMSVWLKDGYLGTVDRSNPATVAAPAVPEHVPTLNLPRSSFEPVTVIEPVKVMPDVSGKKLSEAVIVLLEFKGKSLTPDEIVATFKDNGYDFSLVQVNSAVGNLTRKGTLQKMDGLVSIPS